MSIVLPTNDCKCATCEYLRKTSAPTVNPSPVPAPWPLAPQPTTVPVPVMPSPYWDGSWLCACGQRVYSYQVHSCPNSTITVTCMMTPLAASALGALAVDLKEFKCGHS